MPKDTTIKSVLIIGSGPIVIGQACEFDYAGSQSARSLREEGIEVILINSNPATIMTDPSMADHVYLKPLTTKSIIEILKAHPQIDAVLPTMGGQTALNLCIEADEKGIWKDFNVRLIGVDINAINITEDREQFKNLLNKIGIPQAPAKTANSFLQGKEIAQEFGFPLVIRPSFTLGGTGAAIVYKKEDFDTLLQKAQALKPLPPKQAAVWVLDATYEQISANEIDQLLQLPTMAQVQFVVITNQVELSERSTDRVYYLHSSPICRSHLFDAVLIAAKRKTKPVYTSSEPQQNRLVPSLEDARKQRRLVLLAEDNLMNQRVIVDQLNALGYAVEVADDGAIALEKWRQYHYPLLLTDLHMPNMSGYDLTSAIRKESLHLSEGAEFTRIVAVTANALKGEEQKCLSVGMDGYITKPIELAALETMLTRWLPHAAELKKTTVSATENNQNNSPICFTTIANFLGNNPAKHEEYLNYFVKHAAELLSNMATAVQNQDRSTVRSVAHQFKSVAKSVGALGLSDDALKLEKAAEESDWPVINEYIRLMQEKYQDVVSYVKQRY